MTNALSEADLAFLGEPRLGILISKRKDDSPSAVPLWFEWTGRSVQFFSARDAAKIARLQRHPDATLLVTNTVGEPEHWIAFDGETMVHEDGGFELAERLAPRYWDMTDPVHEQTLATWREHADALCRVTLSPQRIRKGH